MSAARRGAPLIGALLIGCILTEEFPQEVSVAALSASGFQARCEAQGIAHAVGCALLCGPDSEGLGEAEAILGYVGAGATFSPDQGGRFQVLTGEVSWVACAPNRFGGLECAPQARPYALRCLPGGVGVGDEAGFTPGQPLIPAAALDASPLSVMAVGAYEGAPSRCLADCVAVAVRGGCEACPAPLGCMETAFGEACHARGSAPLGAPCAGHARCESLRCGIGGRCE
ncbi:hypothetical protein KKF91_20485 [Myxococcota bacterium]|nr:hypothetical protein [Myxococcota bacterium]MBU1432924.1 hypothetical protein [Myxococcota bacterium]MBU1899670.1 hypothetical protein [Myxococcota bacterium]